MKAVAFFNQFFKSLQYRLNGLNQHLILRGRPYGPRMTRLFAARFPAASAPGRAQ